uniref:Regulatory protein E2 n=1 Tax=Human papillomavirus TaxID=10566 RepID=A0A385PHM3_9PAPI|nr:MAG: E2 protein [Human papillomavirus]
MEKLTERYDAVQEALLNLYENASNDIETQIKHWELNRQENAILFVARQNGLKKLGMHSVPSLATSEHKAKDAIRMHLLLKSLRDSPFGNETWSLTETSLELLNAPPRNCFKKGGYTVDVLYDRDEDKLYPYTSWENIYFQDEQNMWHKTSGAVDYYGLYFYDERGQKIYYVQFDDKAKTLSVTGEWEVRYKNKTISPSVTSSSSASSWKSASGPGTSSKYSESDQESVRRPKEKSQNTTGATSQSSPNLRHTRGRREGESGATGGSPAKRRRTEAPDSTGPAVPTAQQVGSSHRSIGRRHLNRLERLQEEARDPPIIIVKGCANTLKCWRFRCKNNKSRQLYEYASTVFRWVDLDTKSRMLFAFKDNEQRDLFLDTVTLPKGTELALGSLNSL